MGVDQDVEVIDVNDPNGDADFEAAFDAIRGNEGTIDSGTNGAAITEIANPDDTDGTPAAPAPTPDPAAEAAAAAAAAQAEADAPVTITRAELETFRSMGSSLTQLQDELRRSTDQVNGRFGSLMQTVDAIKAQASQGIKPTNMQLTRLAAEYPDLAEMFKADLEDAFGAGNATQPPAGEQAASGADNQPADQATASGDAPGAAAVVDPLSDARVQAALRKKDLAIVDAKHPGWRDLPKSAGFNEWRTSLPQEQQTLLAASWDADVLSDAIADFKSWEQQRAARQQETSQRSKRLENGVPATVGNATGKTAIDDEAAFLSGFDKVRNGGR